MKVHPGEWGSNLIQSTVGQTGRWYMLWFLEDTVFASLTDNGGSWDGSIASVTFKQGDFIFGDFTRVALTSGAVMAYKQRAPSD